MKQIVAYIVVFSLVSSYAAFAALTVAQALWNGSADSCRMDCCGDNCDCNSQATGDSKSEGCKPYFCTANSSLAILGSGQLRFAFDFSIYSPFAPHQSETLLPSLIDHPPRSLA